MWWLLASKIGYAIFGAICYHVVKLMRKREKFKTFFYFHGLLVREYFPNTTKYPGRGRALLEDIYEALVGLSMLCLLYTSPSPRDGLLSRMPSSA